MMKSFVERVKSERLSIIRSEFYKNKPTVLADGLVAECV